MDVTARIIISCRTVIAERYATVVPVLTHKIIRCYEKSNIYFLPN